MNRIAILLLLFAFAAVACGGETERPGSATANRAAGAAELAPDFSLILDDGSTFVLSEATRPTYLVFWAEW